MLPGVELEVRHLRALCAIADTGSVHKAARQLGMTQPSLTTQLRRIEQAVGGQLFTRQRTGSKPTPLGRTVLTRARPIVAQMTELVREAKDAAGLGPGGPGTRLRLGSTGSRAVPGWLRRLNGRLPERDITFQTDVSANTLLRMVAGNQLDAAFVHEVEGSPLRVPDGVELRVLVRREPQFVAVHETHAAARAGRAVALAELADQKWMVDPSVDGDWDGLRRVFVDAGVDPRIVYGDYLSAGDLVAAGEVVTPCQPTAQPRPGMSIVPLEGDPLGVRLVVGFRSGTGLGEEGDAVFADLRASYEAVARSSPAYARWLTTRNAAPAPPFQRFLGAPPPDSGRGDPHPDPRTSIAGQADLSLSGD
ncbi:LysR family transcriptional regulator [Streptomyces diacarni]|uniref:LysR family transcriptional regulator n=1 Tax=Streptomyces diacarni TaxID=2800381 RepID=A0A367F6S9_9ACTN|nr:LysR family transcriptional regulator [Streptomyces diacarni]RCG26066.1 LysR family transcriptional regulator [Streptomyces diacarni]